uniref:Uncharacterized protein n=1 Tax=Alexandrium monilatum TaxID=311494 RepID=A0A7S4QQ33_9DINO|mmetsp:Transcript_874/g.2884  ORF Transcript_874/g.2884 Transcript_874/m.2884 type:complete len:398 (-) Transcript_874:281-1474(-)
MAEQDLAAKSGCCSSDSEDERPIPASAGSGAPRPLARERINSDKRERANELVAEMAKEYRADLLRQVLSRPSAASADAGARSDLEIVAQEFCADVGLFPADPRSPRGSPTRRTGEKDAPRGSSRRSASPVAGLGSSGGSGTPANPAGASRDNVIIIFDWDDTLLPTWWVQEMVNPYLPPGSKEAKLPSDSPHYDSLAAHASSLKAMLMLARAVAQVAIVTLAVRPWVFTSAERFLPGIDLPELLRELGIPIFYAREHVKQPDACLAQVEEGVDIFTVAKRATMMKCLRKLSRKWKRARMNVISIGDSLAEKDAIKEVLWAACEQPGLEDAPAPLCKTVKFVYQPTLHQLRDELQLLAMWLRRMASHDEDFDISMEEPEDLRSQGQSLCTSFWPSSSG